MEIHGVTPNPINGIKALEEMRKSGESSQKSAIEGVGESFSSILNGLNESQLNTDSLVQQMAAGEDVDLHEVMIALEENDINFKVAMGIRDKLVDAYREVMRMQV
jgi:flagellar hook-basal body complex protein FliE